MRSEIEEGEIGDDEEFDDGYDENLMGDENDQRRLALMTEKEREQELFNRSEQREILKTRFKLQRKILAKRKSEEEKKQTKQRNRKRLRASEIYSSDESDEYTPDNVKSGGDSNFTPKTTRSKTILSSSSSSSSSPSSSASNSDVESSDDEDASSKGEEEVKPRVVQDDFIMSLNHLRAVQLKRDTIQKWIYEPFFIDTAIGLFVKVSVAQVSAHREPSYKIGQIMDIIKRSDRTYFVNSEASKGKTDLHCVLRIGKLDKTFQMSFVSNKSFDETDYQIWLETMRVERHPMPTRDFYQKKLDDLQKAKHYTYTNEDIASVIKEKSRFQNSPFNFAIKRTELLGKKADAELEGNLEEAREIQKEIDDLEEKARNLEKQRSSKTFSAISYVNERNRMKNIVDCERALRESKIVRTEDPFTRRKCTPQIVHNKNNANGTAVKNSPLPGNDTSSQSSGKFGEGSSSQPKEEEKNSSDPVNDLFQAHADIELDIDIS